MDFNFLLFPVPQSAYKVDDFPTELVFIPRGPDQLGRPDPTLPIPCLYLPHKEGSSKLIVYFHGNAEDLGQAYELLDHLRSNLKMHVLAVEYPGYGVYPGSPNAERILEDTLSVWNFLTQQAGVSPSDIILFGRSLGSGPATELAAFVNPCALLLMTAYTSIRNVVSSMAGKLAGFLVSERFRNIDNIKNVTCPTFIIHGLKDTLIPAQHSEELHAACAGPCSLLLSNEMDHNVFDFYDDLSQPFDFFLTQCGINQMFEDEERNMRMIAFPEELYRPPDDRFSVVRKQGFWGKMSAFLI